MKRPLTLSEKQAKRLEAAALFAQDLSNAEIARRIGITRSNVSQWYQLWKAGGTEALTVRAPGPTPRLSLEQWQQILSALLAGPQSNGFDTPLWTLERIADLIERLTSVRYNSHYVAELMHEQGWSVQKPERRAKERNEEAIAGWVAEEWPALKRGLNSERRQSSS